MQHSFLVAQEELYARLTRGTYQVGFMDTVIYDNTYRYKAYAYEGKKPFFVQIWHPLQGNTTNKAFLHLGDFFETGKRPDLSVLKQELEKRYKEIIIRDFVAENPFIDTAVSLKVNEQEELFKKLLLCESKSILQPLLTPCNFPVIVYHHGSQSMPFENYLMAEYFASRGYIFVAVAHHLPYENTIFGLKPYNLLVPDEEENSLKTVVNFAQSLSTSSQTFFIGHSWGAQMGFRTFEQDTTVSGMVSLETTLEFKTDPQQINELWPEMFRKISIEKAYYPFPILLCAATGKKKPFNFFDQLLAKELTFISTKEEFEHNAYLSMFYQSAFLGTELSKNAIELFENRFQIYVRHLELMNDFFTGIGMNRKRHRSKVLLITE